MSENASSMHKTPSLCNSSAKIVFLSLKSCFYLLLCLLLCTVPRTRSPLPRSLQSPLTTGLTNGFTPNLTKTKTSPGNRYVHVSSHEWKKQFQFLLPNERRHFSSKAYDEKNLFLLLLFVSGFLFLFLYLSLSLSHTHTHTHTHTNIIHAFPVLPTVFTALSNQRHKRAVWRHLAAVHG